MDRTMTKTDRPALAACRLVAEIHNYCLAHPDVPRMPRAPEQNAAVHKDAWDFVDCMIVCWFEDESRKCISLRAAKRRAKQQNKPVGMAFSLSPAFYDHMERNGDPFRSEPWTPALTKALAETFEKRARAAA